MPKVPAEYIEAKRDAIIEAARHAFFRKGTQATTMADIAREVGLTPGALYRYFPTKGALISSCFDDTTEELAQRWKHAPDPSADPLDELGELATLTFGQLHRPEERIDTAIHLEHELSMVREGDAEGLAEAMSGRVEATGAIESRLRAAQERGILGPDFDPALLAEALVSFYWGVRLSHMLQPDTDTDGQLRQMLLLMEHAGKRT
ncbi:MAG: TetR/AcrR family transcriptional regulator [Hyphomicrobiales bacterium]